MDKLYHALVNDRMTLPKVLGELGGSHETIHSTLKEIVDTHKTTIGKLLLGEVGDKTNRTMAIYELPTLELIDSIIKIAHHNKIKQLHELGSGMGLLTCLINSWNPDIRSIASDSSSWLETSYKMKYVLTYRMYMYDLMNPTIKDPAIICAWPPQNTLARNNFGDLEFVDLIETKKPTLMILIGEPMYNNEYSFHAYIRMKEMGYQIVTIPIKQICYRDYHSEDGSFHSKSVLTVCSHSLRIPNNTEEVLNQIIPAANRDIAAPMTKETIIRDLVEDGIIPRIMIDVYQEPPSDFDEMMGFISKKLTGGVAIPQWISSWEHMQIWRYLTSYNIPLPSFIDNTDDMYAYYLQFYDVVSEKIPTGWPKWTCKLVPSERLIYLYVSMHDSSGDWTGSKKRMIAKYRELISS